MTGPLPALNAMAGIGRAEFTAHFKIYSPAEAGTLLHADSFQKVGPDTFSG